MSMKTRNTQAKYQNIKFLTTYGFVFLPKMQQGGLFQLMKPQMFSL